MNPKEIERAAYIAAYRILTANISSPELACAGTRRSRAIDAIAGIIKDTLELHRAGLDQGSTWTERQSEARPAAAVARGGRVLLELPQRPLNRMEEPRINVAESAG
jgi:hypothetical protein